MELLLVLLSPALLLAKLSALKALSRAFDLSRANRVKPKRACRAKSATTRGAIAKTITSSKLSGAAFNGAKALSAGANLLVNNAGQIRGTHSFAHVGRICRRQQFFVQHPASRLPRVP
jgi:hypothetical protein